MTTKSDYPSEEWTTLLQAPANAATYVITADMSVMGALKEMKALGKAVEKQSAPEAAQELVSSLVADLKEKTKNKESVDAPQIEDSSQARQIILEGLGRSAKLVEERGTSEEAAGFKQWLRDVAQTVAEADKEGSHFGIGGVRVTDKEKAALAEIESALGL